MSNQIEFDFEEAPAYRSPEGWHAGTIYGRALIEVDFQHQWHIVAITIDCDEEDRFASLSRTQDAALWYCLQESFREIPRFTRAIDDLITQLVEDADER